MVFASPIFLFLFLPLTLAAYFAVPRSWRNGVLLVSSLVFYAWGEAPYLALVLGSVAVGARVVGSAERGELVWSAAHDLPAGSMLGVDDLVATSVRLAGSTRQYVDATTAPPAAPSPAPVAIYCWVRLQPPAETRVATRTRERAILPAARDMARTPRCATVIMQNQG